MLHASHTARPQRRPVHDERIQLDLGFAIEKAAAARIECLIVFHDDDRFLHRIQRRSATLQNAPSSGYRVPDAVQMRLDHIVRNSPGTAVNHQNRIVRQNIPHGVVSRNDPTV